MDVKQDQAIKRLLKKLSALRATLNNDERRLLDELVVGSADEVKLQSMKINQKQAVKQADADEVKLQSMKINQKQAVKQADADEVKLQSIGLVIFDPTKEEYQHTS
jgi:hypothetical protein